MKLRYSHFLLIFALIGVGLVMATSEPAQEWISVRYSSVLASFSQEQGDSKDSATEDTTSSYTSNPLIAEGNIDTPDATTYAVARTLNIPYKCTYTAPSFFGEQSSFEADVYGDDFIAVEVPSSWDQYREEEYNSSSVNFLRFSRKDGWAYFWIDFGDGPELGATGGKFDYRKVTAATPNTTYANFKKIYSFTEPDPDSKCTKSSSVKIELPNLAFPDETDQLVLATKEWNQAEIKFAESVPGDRYLPAYENYMVEYWISDSNQGLSDPNKYSIGFRYRDKETKAALYDIEQSKVSRSYYNPPTDCRQIDAFDDEQVNQKEPCIVAGTTDKGIVVYRHAKRTIGQQFFFSIGSNLFKMEFYNLAPQEGTKCDAKSPVCGLTKQELSLIDSFRKIEIDQVLNYFERM